MNDLKEIQKSVSKDVIWYHEVLLQIVIKNKADFHFWIQFCKIFYMKSNDTKEFKLLRE